MISPGDLVRIKGATLIHAESYKYKSSLVGTIQKITRVIPGGTSNFPDHKYIVSVKSLGGLQFSEEELEIVFTV